MNPSLLDMCGVHDTEDITPANEKAGNAWLARGFRLNYDLDFCGNRHGIDGEAHDAPILDNSLCLKLCLLPPQPKNRV